MNDILKEALTALQSAGASKAECALARSELTELNFEAGVPTLMRTVHSANLHMTALSGSRKGTTVVNDLQSIGEAAAAVVAQAGAAQDDEANDIAALEEGQTEYTFGVPHCEPEQLYARLDELLRTTREQYPQIVYVDGLCKHVRTDKTVANTNGVSFRVSGGYYEFTATFCAKEGDRATSMNYTGAAHLHLDKPFVDWGGLALLFEQSIKELEAAPLGDKFVGDIIAVPFVTDELVQSYLGCFLKDGCLISGTSLLKDKMGQCVAAPSVCLRSDPADPRLLPEFITADNYRSHPVDIIGDGVLKSFLLGQYGALKTGLPRSGNQGGSACLRPGTQSLEELIAGVKKGILLGRFSGGAPNDKGDLTGVAKNSFLIENGKLGRPLQETMIAANLLELFRDVRGISADVLSTGYNAQPWVRFGNVSISG